MFTPLIPKVVPSKQNAKENTKKSHAVDESIAAIISEPDKKNDNNCQELEQNSALTLPHEKNDDTAWQAWLAPNVDNDPLKLSPSSEEKELAPTSGTDSDFLPLWKRVEAENTEKIDDEAFEAHDWESQPFADESEAVVVEDVTVPETDAPLLNADEIEAIRKAAELDGYQEGFAKGEAHGRTSGEKAVKAEWDEKFAQQFVQQQAEQDKAFNEQLEAKQKEVNALTEVVNSLKKQVPTAIKQYEQQMQNWLLDAVVHLTQAVVSHEINKDSQHIQNFIQAGIKALPLYDALEEMTNLRIYVSAEDFARCQALSSEIELDNHSQWHWLNALKADSQLSVGDCRIVTPESQVPFSLGDRLQLVCNEFLEEAKDQL